MATSAPMDPANPSLFELLSETQLRELLEPSLRYLLAVLTERHPRYLIRILNRWDEVYALLMLAIEHHYLARHQGGFTENFYALKRERVLAAAVPRAAGTTPEFVARSTRLARRDRWASLAVMIGVPYLKRKADDFYEHGAGGAAQQLFGAGYRDDAPAADAPLRERARHRLVALFRAAYPSANAAYHLATLAFSLGFLFDRTAYHSPWLWLIGVRMRRLGEAEARAAATPSARALPPAAGAGAAGGPQSLFASLFTPSVLTRIILPKLLDSLKLLLPTSIFFLKFLEWWHASDFARQLAQKTAASIELPPPKLPPPPPPPEDDDADDADTEEWRKVLVKVPEDSGLCPICTREITNPTACQTGFVFCYPCVFRWVQGGEDGVEEEKRDRCPVTGVRLLGGTEGLRRLMV